MIAKIWCGLCFFAAGSNFERLLSGEGDTIFKSQWVLAGYVVAGLFAAWAFFPTPPTQNGKTG